MTPMLWLSVIIIQAVLPTVQVELHSARWLTENVREALEWDSIPNMLYGLKDGKEVLKMCVSALKSDGWDLRKFAQVKKNTLYVCFITRQGVARPNVDSIHIWVSTAIHRLRGYCQIWQKPPKMV